MKTIGLIGGMSWESTVTYYRYINEAIRDNVGGLSSAKILLNSLDFSQVVALQKQGKWQEAGLLLGSAAKDLSRAGANCLLICTNTMHLVAEQVADMVGDIPLINIIDETAKTLIADSRKRPLLLATKYTVEHGFYTEKMADLGLDIMVPDAADRDFVQQVIFEELCCGRVNPVSRIRFLEIVEKCRAAGGDSVILGCTEIQLLISPETLPLPGYDSTKIHADAAVEFALADHRLTTKRGPVLAKNVSGRQQASSC